MERIINNRGGQAGILDGLLLLIITSICAIALISIAGSYGTDALNQYDLIYKQKLAQSALLSLYHVTDDSKSIMAHVSQDVANGDFSLVNSGVKVETVLKEFQGNLGWHFGFALLDKDSNEPMQESYVGTDSGLSFDRYRTYPKICASAALTYPEESGEMNYQLFHVCVWSAD